MSERYTLRIQQRDGRVGESEIDGRQLAEECLLQFARGAGLAVDLHPSERAYSDSTISTAYPAGGDAFLNAVAVLRRKF